MLERLLAIELRDWTPKVLALLTLIGYFTIQWFLLTHVIPQEMREIVMRGLGTLDALITMAFSYYYTGSNSSQKRQAIIEQAAAVKE